MKNLSYLLIFLIIGASCTLDNNNYRLKLLTIDESTVPQNFTFKNVDTISVKYTLPNGCHHFHSLYYQFQDTTRIIAIRAIENLDQTCTEGSFQKELKIPIKVLQQKDYVFKFWKGKDNDDKDVFEEKVVPVN